MADSRRHFVGLMSGTSMDGVDAGLLTINGGFRLRQGITRPYPSDLYRRLLHLVDSPHRVSLDELGALDSWIGECFADAVAALLDNTGLDAPEIEAIGSHGQTVRHDPLGSHPFTLQIGDPNVIAARTGITTVADFRRRDVALGGQGAPLAPAFHRAAFAHPAEERVVMNIGGMSNITVLHGTTDVSGHDTGPGNVLMDAWCHQHHGEPFDAEGRWARTGEVDTKLLDGLMSEEFFSRPPPKSTGRETFNLPWLTGQLLAMDEAPQPENVQATLAALTVRSIAESIQRYAPRATRCLVCGGGAHNTFLMELLAAALDDCVVESTDQHGIAPQWVEAAAFAWLARQTLDGGSGNLPAVTGAAAATVLGAVYSGA